MHISDGRRGRCRCIIILHRARGCARGAGNTAAAHALARVAAHAARTTRRAPPRSRRRLRLVDRQRRVHQLHPQRRAAAADKNDIVPRVRPCADELQKRVLYATTNAVLLLLLLPKTASWRRPIPRVRRDLTKLLQRVRRRHAGDRGRTGGLAPEASSALAPAAAAAGTARAAAAAAQQLLQTGAR